MSQDYIKKSMLEESWQQNLGNEFDKPYMQQLREFLRHEKDQKKIIYPKSVNVFQAFSLTPLDQVKVVILGQDPYHDRSYDGFAFSNTGKPPNKISPSLRNIFAEIRMTVYSDDEDDVSYDPNLERWAKQGVLLINTAHTVIKGEAGSHTGMWKPFTKKVIEILLTYQNFTVEHPHIAWILWGNNSYKLFSDVFNVLYKEGKIQGDHLILHSAHPSPLSAYQGFFGSNHFNQVNEFLKQHDSEPIIW